MGTKAPRISVLMPVYNAEPFLENAIESILNQSFTDFELLIFNDGSTDNSEEILFACNDNRVKLFGSKTNHGVVHTTNTLFKLSCGEFITLQDADDWSAGSRLEEQERAFRNDNNLMLCGSQCMYVRDQRCYTSNFPTHHKKLINALKNGETSLCCGASVMFRSALIEKYGMYRTFFDRIGAEHLDFFWRMIDHEKFINLPSALYNYRANQDSLSRSTHNNPLQFYSTKLALLAYWQRKLTGKDFIENLGASSEIVDEIQKHHKQYPSITSSRAASTQLAFGNTEKFITLLKQSFVSYGVTSANLKAIVTAVPLILLCRFSPKSLKRFLVQKSNRRFLAQHGINRY